MHAAVFVDFENLFHSLNNRDELTGHRTRDLCLGILERLKERLRDDKSPMVLGRSYAAFDAYPGMEVAHDLALMGFDPQYVLIGHQGKNAADVQLACDVCRVLYRRPDIDAIVIVSGDRDFIPIARQVLEENRELRVVAIPDSTSGDLRMRVGAERFWNALDLITPDRLQSKPQVPAVPAASSGLARDDAISVAPANGHAPAGTNGNGAAATPIAANDSVHGAEDAARAARGRAAIVGHIPVTWRAAEEHATEGEQADRLQQCIELILRAQARHGSSEVWLSPFLKGPMSQHFSGLVHPERRALVNELRHRGVIHIEERANQYADHPYSVIVLDTANPMVAAVVERMKKRDEVR
ncbi:MAG: NYN domain-containing protein [Planctomycetes bacterium]|nr:NYN domain-containing protein [Planctomycetota bacterium]